MEKMIRFTGPNKEVPLKFTIEAAFGLGTS